MASGASGDSGGIQGIKESCFEHAEQAAAPKT